MLEDLTAAEQRLMEALIANPAQPFSTVCELAQVNRQHAYRIMAKDDFKVKLRGLVLNVAGEGLVEAIEAMKESAKLQGKDGHADRKLLFELTGVYTPRKELHVEQKTPDVLPDETYVSYMLKAGIPIEKWAPGVRARYEAGMVPGYPAEGTKS